MKKRKFFKCFLIVVLCFAVLGAALLLIINGIVKSTVRDRILSTDEAAALTDVDCILVLGCQVKDDGTPSDMLKDRLTRGVEVLRRSITYTGHCILLSSWGSKPTVLRQTTIHMQGRECAISGKSWHDVRMLQCAFLSRSLLFLEIRSLLQVPQKVNNLKSCSAYDKLLLKCHTKCVSILLKSWQWRCHYAIS